MADINFETEKKRNAVLYACELGCKADVINYLISIGIDYSKNDKFNNSALKLACWYCSNDEIDIFLNLNQKVTEKDIFNWTSLHSACRHNSIEVVKKIFDIYTKETNCNKEQLNDLKNDTNSTLLHLVVCNSFEVTQFFIDKVDLDIQNNENNTALHSACLWTTDTNIIKLLLEKGAKTDIINNEGFKPIEYGIKENMSEDVKKYLKSLK